MKVKDVLAAAVLQNPPVLFLNEPSNCLDFDDLGALVLAIQDLQGMNESDSKLTSLPEMSQGRSVAPYVDACRNVVRRQTGYPWEMQLFAVRVGKDVQLGQLEYVSYCRYAQFMWPDSVKEATAHMLCVCTAFASFRE